MRSRVTRRACAWSATIVFAAAFVASCAAPEDPHRVELRARLRQDAQLSKEELDALLDEVKKGLEGKTVRVRQSPPTPLTEEQRVTVLSMLEYRSGVFDERLRTNGETSVRVINAPGDTPNPEYEAARHLWIDVATLLPIRFEFTYTGGVAEDYAFDLIVE